MADMGKDIMRMVIVVDLLSQCVIIQMAYDSLGDNIIKGPGVFAGIVQDWFCAFRAGGAGAVKTEHPTCTFDPWVDSFLPAAVLPVVENSINFICYCTETPPYSPNQLATSLCLLISTLYFAFLHRGIICELRSPCLCPMFFAVVLDHLFLKIQLGISSNMRQNQRFHV